MSFTSFWPLVFLAGIPAIIILYILKPKGKDVEISSNLLWKRLFKNRQSKSFFEKFRSEILMFLQILLLLILMLALMAPYVMTKSGRGGNTTIIIDKSLSMQHALGQGRTRLDAAKEQAAAYVGSGAGNINIIDTDGMATILIANSTDRSRLKEVIAGIEASDKEGGLQDAYRLASGLESDHVLILTDGEGVASAEDFAKSLHADVIDCGEAASNVSLDYISYSAESGEAAARFTNYSDEAAGFEVTLYDSDGSILAMQQLSAEAGRSSSVLFSDITPSGQYIRAELSAIRFGDSSASDSLAGDNTSYALLRGAGTVRGILIGEGNTFIERAYRAVCGESLTRSVTDSVLSSGGYNVAIYDAGYTPRGAKSGRMEQEHDEEQYGVNILRFDTQTGSESLKNVLITAAECELTQGLKEFSIGSNSVQVFEVPEWAESFLSVGDKCVGYYGINGSHKEVVLGFDIRETDFAVKAEFPVFMAGALGYLSDMNILGKNVYDAGESLKLNPSADFTAEELMVYAQDTDMGQAALSFESTHAGLYRIAAGDREEYFYVRAAASGRDGRATSEDIRNAGVLSENMARRSLSRVLLIAALILLVAEWLIYARRMNYRARFYLVCRSILLLLCILSMLDIRIAKRSRQTATVFLVDLSVSDSDNLKSFDEYIDEAVSRLPKRNSYAIVTFGRDAAVQQFMTDEDMYMGLGTKTDASATDFENGLQRAVSLLPADSAGRIVVLTDGKETAGNIGRSAGLFADGDISLEAILLESASGEDAYVAAVDMPDTLHEGESYYLKVLVESNYDTDAQVILSSGGKEVARESVRLHKGSNEFVFEETVSGEDVESYEVNVLAEGDTVPENDSYSAYARVEDSPRVLVLKGKGEGGSAFENVLEAAHVNVEFLRPERAPEELNDMLAYKGIILQNVYIDELPEGFVDNLESYVRDYGGGFAACGGEDSFMLGGYNDTAIETVLPVNMELRGTLEIPSTAIVMVIDHSGSMTDYAGAGMTYLDVAVEAAERGVDNLRDTDQVGILAFDDRFTWVHHLDYAKDKDDIKDDIETIRDGGGTVIMPALNEARRELAGCNAEVKHIILLTDGMGETNNFTSVTDPIKRAGITLSTVAVGQYSDQKLMEDLANTCGGRYYYADGNTDIPRIFAQEVFLGGSTYLKNGDYKVFSRSRHELTDGLFKDGWPGVLGYVAASPKTGAQELLVSGLDDPLLTVWQYGLGKTVAFNSDVDGGWSAAYSGESDYAELWKRIVDYIGGTPGIGEDHLEVESRDGKTYLSYYSQSYGDSTEISGIYTSPEGGGGEISFSSPEPGVYTAEIDSIDTGLYNINVRRSDAGEVSGAYTTATVVQYSDEYRFDVTDERFKGFIEKYGSWRSPDDNVWKKLNVNKNGRISLTPFFLSLLILLFLLDVAGRRFGWEPPGLSLPKKEKPVAEGAAEAAIKPKTEEDIAREAIEEEKAQKQRRMERMRRDGLNVPDTGSLDTAALLKRKKDRNGI